MGPGFWIPVPTSCWLLECPWECRLGLGPDSSLPLRENQPWAVNINAPSNEGKTVSNQTEVIGGSQQCTSVFTGIRQSFSKILPSQIFLEAFLMTDAPQEHVTIIFVEQLIGLSNWNSYSEGWFRGSIKSTVRKKKCAEYLSTRHREPYRKTNLRLMFTSNSSTRWLKQAWESTMFVVIWILYGMEKN